MWQKQVMMVSTSPAPSYLCHMQWPASEACWKNSSTWGLHSKKIGDISHLISPLKGKTARSWAVGQQRHSQLPCGDTVNLQNHFGTVSALWLSIEADAQPHWCGRDGLG